jgi:hypothetical protein
MKTTHNDIKKTESLRDKNLKIFSRIMLFLMIVFCLLTTTTGCKKLVEVDPPYTSFSAENVYTNDASAISAINSIYAKLSAGSMFSTSLTTLSLNAGLSADEFNLYSGVSGSPLLGYYQNSLNSSNTTTTDYWANTYPVIFNANTAIQGLKGAQDLTPIVKQQLLGEALFMRAFCYFYLVNLYGDVPLILGTDYTVNAGILRSPTSQVWDQIKTDLKEADNLMTDNFPDKLLTGASTERIRPTKWAAEALLSRVYLYTSNYADAEVTSSLVIANKTLFAMTDVNSTFKKNNPEAIWQLQPVNTGWNTEDARTFIITSTGPNGSHPVYLSNWLLNEFETGDFRQASWTNSVTVGANVYVYPFKYLSAKLNDPVTEYNNVLRLAEQFLIRSEARVQLGKTDDAIADLDVIRNRAGLPNYNGATDQTTLRAALLHENQVEFFSEWGHRWLDLKRTAHVNTVMAAITPLKGGVWSANWQLYPITADELRKTPGLLQNPGY